MVRVAAVQFDPSIGAIDDNLDTIERDVEIAADRDIQLAVFPECAVSGYVFQSLDEARQAAQTIPGSASRRLVDMARRHNLYLVAGLLERSGDRVFNSALLAGPDGVEAVYRKTHTLCLGVDRFTTPGDLPYRVHNLPFGRVAILICYDLRFPEPARILALRGAHMILLPTNWPESSTIQADVFTRARAAENRLFVIAADRVGTERGTHFLGRSQVVGPGGDIMAEGSRDRAEMLVCDIEVSQADVKNVVVRPGIHEMDCMNDRRPDLYSDLVPAPLEVR